MQQNNQVAITAAVVGMGGVGKTELAIQYARQHLETIYTGGVCFLTGSSFISDIFQFARPLFFPKMDFTGFSEAEQLAYCWQHWAEGDVLLIVDNVTNYKQQVKPYLPGSPRFKVLITTREQIPNITPLNLEVLHPDDALKLLKLIVGEERIQAEPETAEQLCQWLGYLPLGLELVGQYLAEDEDLSLAKMLQRLQRKRLQHSSLQNEDDTAVTAELGVAAAFELSWERLQQHPETQQLGCLLSLFYPKALDMRQRLFQEDHPDFATSLNNLANLYDSQGRYSEAEPLYQQALEMSERTLGDSHPNTITVRGNYADCLRKSTATQKNNQPQKSSSVEDLLQQMETMIDRLKQDSSE